MNEPEPPTPNAPTPLPGPVVRAVSVLLPVGWIGFAAASHWPGLKLTQRPSGLVLDKWVHVVGFTGLTVLLVWTLWGRRWMGRGTGLVFAAALMAVYALLDEWTQRWVGRQATWQDLVADGSGIALGLLLAAWAAGRVRRVWADGAPATDTAGDVAGADRSSVSQDGSRFVGHAVLVSALTLLSRLTGLVRDATLLAVFGRTQTMSAFFFGFMVPNLFRRLFGEGALAAAFLPRYRRLLDEDLGLARRYAAACGWRAAAAVWMMVAVAEVALLGVWFGANLSEKAALAVGLTAVMLPYAPLVCGVAFLGAVLQAHGRFGPAAFVPVLLNLGMIAAAAVAAWAVTSDQSRVFVIAGGVLVCGVTQLVWVAGALQRLPRATPQAALTLPECGDATPRVRELLRATWVAMLPMVVGLGVFQINTLMDGLIAYGLSAPDSVELDAPSGLNLLGRIVDYPVDAGALATLTAAQRLYQFPLGVFGIAIATAIFPALAAAGRDENRAAFSAIVRRGIRLTLFIALPATVGLMFVRLPLTRVMFERGAFTLEDAKAAAHVLAGYAAGVWAYSLTHVLTRAFYARDDAKTPLRVAVGMVVVNLTLNLTLIWPLGAAGLAWSTAVSATMQTLLLAALLRRQMAPETDGQLWRGIARALMATGVMAVMLGVTAWSNPPGTFNWYGELALLVLMVCVGAACYMIVTLALNCEELGWLRRG